MLFVLAVAGVALAPMDPADFLAEWPNLLGQRATVSGTIYNATEDSMLLELPAETVRLIGPWVDRNDLRYLFRYCFAADAPKAKCTMPVTGTVRAIQGRVQLESVDFQPPAQP